jgi:predicted TIM-barrel fold metal-dependent hydrolase
MMKFLLLAISFTLLQITLLAQVDSAVFTEKYTGPIIDMHIHAYDEGHPFFGMTHPPTLRNKTYKGATSAADQKKQVISKFKEHNIVRAVVTHGELWDNGGNTVLHIGQADKDTATLRQQFNSGKLQVLAEIAPFYEGFQANDDTLMTYYALAEKLNIPVGIHVFPGGPNYGLQLMPQILGKMRAKNANPLQLEEVLVAFPELKIYIMHGGWPFVDEVKALMYMHPNLYVDIAVINWILPQKELENYVKSLIDAGFGSRIMYGSDQMVWAETIRDGIASVNKMPFLSLEQKADIFYNNAARFLTLSEEQIKADQHKKWK